jgi:predicted kinase
MNKLIILVGIQGSGKSTYARKLALSDPSNIVIVSRDSIRSSLGKYWVPSREKLVTEIELSSIWHGLDLGYTVIIDATNFKHEKFKLMAESYEIPCEIKYFDIPLWKAKLRVIKRFLLGGRWISFKVITNFHKRYVKIQKRR